MAHALLGYNGPCAQLHGHSYKLEVTVECTPMPNSASPCNGMIMDFGQLKAIVQEQVIDLLDHGPMLNASDPILGESPRNPLFKKTIIVPFQPT